VNVVSEVPPPNEKTRGRERVSGRKIIHTYHGVCFLLAGPEPRDGDPPTGGEAPPPVEKMRGGERVRG